MLYFLNLVMCPVLLFKVAELFYQLKIILKFSYLTHFIRDTPVGVDYLFIRDRTVGVGNAHGDFIWYL